MKKVAIIMGSDSDFPVVSKAVTKLKEFGVPYEVHVMSAHRTPDAAIEFSGSAKKNGFGDRVSLAGYLCISVYSTPYFWTNRVRSAHVRCI